MVRCKIKDLYETYLFRAFSTKTTGLDPRGKRGAGLEPTAPRFTVVSVTHALTAKSGGLDPRGKRGAGLEPTAHRLRPVLR